MASNFTIQGRTQVGMTASLIALNIVLWCPRVMGDSDTYLHVAAGRWILLHGKVPMTDPFSYTFAGSPWVAHEWLAEVIMGGAYRLGGWNAVVSLFALATALTFGLLARHLLRWLTPLAAVVALIVIGSCVAPGLLARPHILVLPLLELWVAGLLIARESGTVPWWLLPAMWPWANMHGSFVFGILVSIPFAIEAVMESRTPWRRTASLWAAFIVTSVVLATITPRGWRGLLFPFQLMNMQSLNTIAEWTRPDFSTVQPIEFGLLSAAYVCATRRVRLPLIRWAILAGLTYMAFAHARNAMLAAVVGSLILAEPIGKALGTPSVAGTGRRGFAAGYVVILVATIVPRFAFPVSEDKKPIAALAHVPPELLMKPVLNDYSFGGYLIYRGISVFIDGRADMYGDGFMARYDTLMHDDASLIATLAERRIGWTILSTGSSAVSIMDTAPGWHRLYGDDVAVVHVRDL